MISKKSNREIETMRQAGKITAMAMQAVGKAIKPGVSTMQLDKIAEEVIRSQGATPSFKGYGGFPASICTSHNDMIIHGIPSDKVILEEGDIISIDCGAYYKGYHGDHAWTFAVGNISEQAQELLDVTKKALFTGLNMVKAGNRIGDVSHAIGKFVSDNGYSVPIEYTGHGIGTHLHEEPAIPNFGHPNQGVLLKEGMTLAIEPMVHIGKPQTKVLQDNWAVVTKDGSLAAHFEHTVLVTNEGYEILTIDHELKEEDSVYG